MWIIFLGKKSTFWINQERCSKCWVCFCLLLLPLPTWFPCSSCSLTTPPYSMYSYLLLNLLTVLPQKSSPSIECTQILFHSTWWVGQLYICFWHVSTYARCSVRGSGLFSWCSVFNMCAGSIASDTILVFRFRCITLLFISLFASTLISGLVVRVLCCQISSHYFGIDRINGIVSLRICQT